MAARKSAPAHRPSRRGEILDAAMRLYARQQEEPVTVAEIAREAYVTTPAIYYHYRSKEAVLEDGLRRFATDLAEQVRQACAEAVRLGSIREFLPSILRWLDTRRDEATVWFVTAPSSIDPSALVDELVAEVLPHQRDAVRAANPGLVTDVAADAAVMALTSLLEESARSWLSDDSSRRALGPVGFLDEITRIAIRLIGEPATH
jgi:AcrR family transcriptional regulator